MCSTPTHHSSYSNVLDSAHRTDRESCVDTLLESTQYPQDQAIERKQSNQLAAHDAVYPQVEQRIKHANAGALFVEILRSNNMFFACNS